MRGLKANRYEPRTSMASSSGESESFVSVDEGSDSECPGVVSDDEEAPAPAGKGRGRAPLQRGLRQTLQE